MARHTGSGSGFHLLWLPSTLSAREVLKPRLILTTDTDTWLLLSTDTDTDPVLLSIQVSPLPLWPGLLRGSGARGAPMLNPLVSPSSDTQLVLVLTTSTV